MTKSQRETGAALACPRTCLCVITNTFRGRTQANQTQLPCRERERDFTQNPAVDLLQTIAAWSSSGFLGFLVGSESSRELPVNSSK